MYRTRNSSLNKYQMDFGLHPREFAETVLATAVVVGWFSSVSLDTIK